MRVVVPEVLGGARPSDRTYRLLWLAVTFDILAFGVGFGWDRQWHGTHPFEDFFSPPHLFIYSTHLLATLTLMAIAFDARHRAAFGPGFRLSPFPFPVPGAVALAGSGFVITALAGVLDAVWHTGFGLDETAWSLPHSMLGWGIFVAFLGVVSCLVALTPEHPIRWPSALVFGFLLIAATIERIPGPFLVNISLAGLEYVRQIPVLAASAPFQHSVRIYETWNITRLHQLFVPLAAMGAGLGIRLLQRFDPRALTLLILTAAVTYTSPWVPYLVPGAVVALAHRRIARRRWLFAAGFAFGVAAGLVSMGIGRGEVGFPLFGAIFASFTFALGAWLADQVWTVVAAPTRRGVLTLTTLAGLVAPALTGVLDLYLRARTP